jgi:hypothetical protein
MPDKKKRYLFDKPQGPSERPWHTTGGGTIREVICKGCGTVHPERKSDDETYSLSWFLGHQIIDECCGAFLDQLYDCLGSDFFQARATDFEQDPLSRDHTFERITVETMVRAWSNAAEKAKTESTEVAAKVPCPQ